MVSVTHEWPMRMKYRIMILKKRLKNQRIVRKLLLQSVLIRIILSQLQDWIRSEEI